MVMVRTTITLPDDVLEQIDAIVGSRGRSAFIAQAAADRVKRERLRRALDETRGALVGKPVDDSGGELPRGARATRHDRRRDGMRYLLDTTVIVDHVRGYGGGSDLLARLFEQTADLCTCDVVTCEAPSRGDEEERRTVRALLEALDFVAVDPEAACWAGDRRRELLAAGRRHPVGDSLIAGLAWRIGATVVTRNVHDFEALGVPVLGYGAPKS